MLLQDDFIAVVLDAGYLVLLIDLGVGDTKEVKNAKFVADNRWYKILIERYNIVYVDIMYKLIKF